MNKLGAFVVGIMVGGVVTVKVGGKIVAGIGKSVGTGLGKFGAFCVTPDKEGNTGFSVINKAFDSFLETVKDKQEQVKTMVKNLHKSGYNNEQIATLVKQAVDWTCSLEEIEKWLKEDETPEESENTEEETQEETEEEPDEPVDSETEVFADGLRYSFSNRTRESLEEPTDNEPDDLDD